MYTTIILRHKVLYLFSKFLPTLLKHMITCTIPSMPIPSGHAFKRTVESIAEHTPGEDNDLLLFSNLLNGFSKFQQKMCQCTFLIFKEVIYHLKGL